MWFWINLIVFVYVLFAILEESMYYFWNRYVYGPKDVKPRYWKNRLATGFYFLLKLKKKELDDKRGHKLSS
nr:hypothetical protein [Neobacillus sp. Marseille-Q6967]